MMTAGIKPGKKLIGDRDDDGFEVGAAWKIVSQTRKAKYDAALERERKEYGPPRSMILPSTC
jgi:hypothetical protein